jgi:hypothetical protein
MTGPKSARYWSSETDGFFVGAAGHSPAGEHSRLVCVTGTAVLPVPGHIVERRLLDVCSWTTWYPMLDRWSTWVAHGEGPACSC